VGGALAVTGDNMIQRQIGDQAATRLFGTTDAIERLKLGPIQRNFFSFCFQLDSIDKSDHRKLFVKIPKTDLRRREATILPLSDQDKALAHEEVKSLRLLADHWDGKSDNVEWIKVVDFLEELNAIITERVDAVDAFSIFRSLDFRSRLGNCIQGNRLAGYMGRLGSALGRFHLQRYKTATVSSPIIFPKIYFYCRELSRQTRNPCLMKVPAALTKLEKLSFQTAETETFKGLDIRNVLIRGDNLFLLDPGKMKRSFREADLARFIMTYRILYWGSPLLLLLGTPGDNAENSFVRGYSSHFPDMDSKLLDLYVLKEQLKHWHTALDSLSQKAWSPLVKSIAARVYVNQFYERQILQQMRKF